MPLFAGGAIDLDNYYQSFWPHLTSKYSPQSRIAMGCSRHFSAFSLVFVSRFGNTPRHDIVASAYALRSRR
jgi:hypothetical protein